MKAGEFAEAIELLGRARALDPDDAQTQVNLGVALQGAGRHTEALEYFGRLQKSLPNDPAPFLQTAVSLLVLGKAETALEAASAACRRAPQMPQALYAYGQAWLALGKPARAEQAFAAALENAPAWAEAWVYCGVARYRQGAIEGAKAAMRQALHHAPGHAAASANLGALMRISGEAEAAEAPARQTTAREPDNPATDVSASPVARTDPGSNNRQAASDNPTLSAWKPEDPAVSLGLAVEFLRKKPAFAKLPFGEWSQVLVGQVNRGHFCFVVDEHRRIHGFFGWALTHQRLAEEWVEGRSGLRDEDCRDGDCVIFNAWAADSHRAVRLLVDIGRKLFEGTRTFYFKRHYSDGRTRPVRLSATDFLSSHIAREAARLANSASNTEIEQPADAEPR